MSRYAAPIVAGLLGLSCMTPPTSEQAEQMTQQGQPLAAQRITGFADLHLHFMAEEAFAGRWLHGSALAALTDCDGGTPPSDHARLKQDLSRELQALNRCGAPLQELTGSPLVDEPFVQGLLSSVGGAALSELIGQTEGSQGDTGLHLQRSTLGSGWPSWDTIAHQQAHATWLERAHARGLQLVVMSAVSYDFLCQLLPEQNGRNSCDEMQDIERQLERVNEFDARTSWLSVVRSPDEARQAIARGELAMVLSIEASHLFGRDTLQDFRRGLERVYALGVRTLQPVHQVDNRFAGAALHNGIFQIAQFLDSSSTHTPSCHVDTDCALTETGVVLGFDVERDGTRCRNTVGLSPEGRELLNELMSRGMLIDMAHMSERSMLDSIGLSQARGDYPLYISHGHPREIMGGRVEGHEKSTPYWAMQAIRRSGGMFGLRTFADPSREYQNDHVPATCQGSSRSFAQALGYATGGLKIDVGFGSDLNGFIQQTGPRFGPDACPATRHWLLDQAKLTPFTAEADCESRLEREAGVAGTGTDFDTKGLAHVGLMPELLTDLENLGADTSSLWRSAEAFVQMWERAQALGPGQSQQGPATSAADLDVSGVGPDPVSKAERIASYPSTCGKHYCPNHQVYGGACRFDAECETGRCSAPAASCGLPEGVCGCAEDWHCRAGQYCGYALNAGTCQTKKSRGSACLYGRECESGRCSWLSCR